MLECFYGNRQAINSMLGNDDVLSDSGSESELNDDKTEVEAENALEFSKNDWKLISAILEILKPVYEATMFVERRSAHAGHIIPLLKILELDLISVPKTNLFPKVREAIVGGLKNRIKGNFI